MRKCDLDDTYHGGRFRVDGSDEDGKKNKDDDKSYNQFTFIERQLYREMVEEVKGMSLGKMLTVLGPIGLFSFYGLISYLHLQFI